MKVLEVTAEEYSHLLTDSVHAFNSVQFNLLNAYKAEKLHFLVFKDTKVRLGLIGAYHEGQFKSPFSAPFGGFSLSRESVSIEQTEKAVIALKEWSHSKDLREIKLGLPPLIYEESHISKLINIFYRLGFSLDAVDLNYSYDLNKFNENYRNNLKKNARKNLTNALKNNLRFYHCQSLDEKSRAYTIIKENREAKGFPFRMTWEQVLATSETINTDFFLVTNNENEVASSIAYHISKDIVHITKWGDRAEYSYMRPMNFLALEIFKYYKKHEISIIDIGHSTNNSLPNYGLCEFKEGLGCDTNLKTDWTCRIK